MSTRQFSKPVGNNDSHNDVLVDLLIKKISGLATQDEESRISVPGHKSDFEYLFNKALISLSQDKFSQAEYELDEAESSGLSKDKDISRILVTKAYIRLVQGKHEEARQLNNQVLEDENCEKMLKAIALLNNFAAEENLNPFLMYRKLIDDPELKADFLENTPADFGRLFTRNIHLLNSLMGKTKSIKTAVKQMEISRLEAVSLQCAGDKNLSQHAIQKLIKREPQNIVYRLHLIQKTCKNDPVSAASSLSKMLLVLEDSVKYQPGLVSLVERVFRGTKRINQAKAFSQEAMIYWKSQNNKLAQTAINAAHIDGMNDKALTSLIEEYSHLDSNIAHAVMSAAYAKKLDIVEAEKHAQRLPQINSLLGNVDVNALEIGGGDGGGGGSMGATAVNEKLTSNLNSKRQLKRMRKRESETKEKRLRHAPPKNYDPAKKPDPERWLPKRERTSYQPKRDKGKKAGAHQGASELVPESSSSQGRHQYNNRGRYNRGKRRGGRR